MVVSGAFLSFLLTFLYATLRLVLEKSPREEEEALMQSCLAANQDPEATAVEEELGRLQDGWDEPWTDAPAR